MIEQIHKIVRDTIRKYRAGYLTPEQIDDAVNRASYDLFLFLLNQYKENLVLPKLLEPFKKRESISLTSGTGTISDSEYAEAISVSTIVDQAEFPAKITDNDSFWKQRTLERILEGKTEQEIQRYIKSIVIDSDEVDLPEDFVKEVAVNFGDFQGIMTTPDKFYSRVIEDLIPDFNMGKKQKYLYIDNEDYDISSTNVFDLPDDFVEGITIFSRVGNQKYEGVILTEVEFLDRINSAILTPTLQEPIARIYDNKIEFYPSDAGNYTLSYYKFPSEKRPLVKIENQKIFTRPFTQEGSLQYYAYPVERDALVRIYGLDVDVDPAVDEVVLYYLRYPVKAKFAYTSPNGRDIVFDSGNSIDLDWKPTAISEIISRALMYFGITLNDQSLTLEEQLKRGN